MKSTGNALIYLVILILAAGLSIYFYFNPFQIDRLAAVASNLPYLGRYLAKSIPTWTTPENWQSYNDMATGLTLSFPRDWTVTDNGIISQYPLPETTPVTGLKQVYNSISISEHSGVLYSGIYDADLFNKIYKSKKGESFNPELVQPDNKLITKISTGFISSGQPFVIFKFESDKLINFNNSIIQSYILNPASPDSIFILTLQNYDDYGIDTFTKIIKSTKLSPGS